MAVSDELRAPDASCGRLGGVPGLSAARCVACGSALPPWPGNCRPRTTCSDGCRRRVDQVREQVRRRLACAVGWSDERGRGRYTEAEVDAGIGLAVEDLVELVLQANQERP